MIVLIHGLTETDGTSMIYTTFETDVENVELHLRE